MRKSPILSSILTIGLLAVVGGAITGFSSLAFFTDTEISSNNTFTAGTLDLLFNSSHTNNISTVFIMTNMKPGDTNSSVLKLTNNGSLAMGTVNFTGAVVDSDVGKNEAECEAEGGTWDGTSCSGQTNVFDISNVTNITTMTFGGTDILFTSPSVNASCNPRVDQYLRLWELRSCTFNLTAVSSLGAGESKNLVMAYQFLSTAGNQYQGDVANLTLTFNAFQQGFSG